MALAGIRQLRSQGPVSVHAHRTEVVTGSKRWEGVNGAGGGIGAGGGNGDGAGAGGGKVDIIDNGDGDGAGTRTGVETKERTQDGNGGGSGTGREPERGWRPVDEHKMGPGTEARAVAEMRTGTRMDTETGLSTGSGRAEER